MNVRINMPSWSCIFFQGILVYLYGKLLENKSNKTFEISITHGDQSEYSVHHVTVDQKFLLSSR